VGLGLCLVTGLAACSPTAETSEVELTLASFAVTRDAYNLIIPQFTRQWQAQHHQKVLIRQSYGGSGAQTRAVVDGLDADIVHLALALDTDRLVKAALVQPDWQQRLPNQGIVTQSVVALATRADNPKGIRDWQDLTRTGVSVITADPQTSGVARWNFMALWSAARSQASPAAGSGASPVPDLETRQTDFVRQVYRNVPILARDAREATDIFLKGQGDVLINYENEMIMAQAHDQALVYSVPERNISIDNPVAIVDRNVDKHRTREVAEAFIRYLFTPEAQQLFAQTGFRPVNPTVLQRLEHQKRFPKVKTLATIKDFGGWKKVQAKFFGDEGVFSQIQVRRM
jgi:sulfate/thiosulfate transport system substrate-binding protein